jgi:hypothetical protein
MMMPSNHPSKRTRKSKTQAQEPPPPTVADAAPAATAALQALKSDDSQFWEEIWLKHVEKAADIAQFCGLLGTTVAEYRHRRLTDKDFDGQCLIFDQLIDMRIIDTLRKQAQAGETRAQGLYFKTVRRAAFDPGFPSWNALPSTEQSAPQGNLSAEIADAMIAAGLEAHARSKRPPDETPKESSDPNSTDSPAPASAPVPASPRPIAGNAKR